MSNSKEKPTVIEICKLAFEANGFAFYQMQEGFNQIFHIYRFMIIHHNPRTNRTHTLFFNNKRVMINYAYKKGYTSYNPCSINRNHYVFQKNALYRLVYNGNRTQDAPELKHISK